MSPEQAEGQVDRLSPASDIYSLGAVLYTLLCGRPPFEYDLVRGHVAAGAGQERRVLAPRQVQAGVAKPLEAICLKAMATAPRGPLPRRQGPGHRHRALAGRRAGGRLSRAAVGTGPARWGRRHRPLVAGAAVLLVTAVAGLSLGILLLGRAQRETEAQRQVAVKQSNVATFMSGEANARAEALRRRDYVNRVNLAYREFLDDNAALAEQILYGCPVAAPELGMVARPEAGPSRARHLRERRRGPALRRLEPGVLSRRPSPRLGLGPVVPAP